MSGYFRLGPISGGGGGGGDTITSTPASLAWLDTDFEKRFVVTAGNTSGGELWDAIVECRLPASASIASGSLRVYEVGPQGSIIKPDAERYDKVRGPNRFMYLPATLEGNYLRIKALGRWYQHETRRFVVLYSATAKTGLSFTHLAATGADAFGHYFVQRSGPDTEEVAAGVASFAVPHGAAFPHSTLTFAESTSTGQPHVPLLTYRVNGDATLYGLLTATKDTVEVNPTDIKLAGSITSSDRGSGPDFLGEYDITYTDHISFLPTWSAGAAAMRPVSVFKTCITLEAQHAITPALDTDWNLLSFYFTGQSSVGGSTPDFWVAPGGSITRDATYSGPAIGAIIGHSSSTRAIALRIDKVELQGFGAASDGDMTIRNVSFGWQLGFGDLSNANAIPAGAKIHLEFTIAYSRTSHTDDNIIAALKWPDIIPGTAGEVETYSTEHDRVNITALGETLTYGATEWLYRNSPAIAGMNGNLGFSYNHLTGLPQVGDDGDSTYGVGHMLHGLALRYKRTEDAGLVPLINRCLEYFLELEKRARAKYGDTICRGVLPYYLWPSATPLVTDDLAAVEWTVNRGEPATYASLEQIQMPLHGMYMYLRHVPVDADLFPYRDDIIALIERMEENETNANASHDKHQRPVAADAYGSGNALYSLTAGALGTPTNNGLTVANTSAAGTLNGPVYHDWQVNNATNRLLDDSANSAIMTFMRAVYAPDTEQQGILNYMRGRANDMLVNDLGRHDYDVSFPASNGQEAAAYPDGWLIRSNVAFGMYDSGRTPTHYILVNSGGTRDSLGLRIAQKAAVLGIVALYDPTYQIKLNEQGSTVPVKTALDSYLRMVHAIGIKRESGMVKLGASGQFGDSGSYPSYVSETAFTSYALMAVEIWHQVQAGTSAAELYR